MIRKHRPLITTASVLVALYVAASLAYDGFFSWYQFVNLFGDNATLGLAAVGMTFVILSGGIDLSVGAVIAFSSMVLAKAVMVWNLHPALAIPLVMILGVAFGSGQGYVFRTFNLPPFLVTLAGMFLARGLALVLTEEKRISLSENPVYLRLSDIYLLDFPLPALLFLGVAVAGIYLARHTRFGRNVYAIGGNEQSALLMGLPVGVTKMRAYALSGLCASLGGVAHTIGSGAGDASVAFMLELDAIAAVVIGGTLLSGGVGSVFGTLLGVLISGIITIIPTYQGNLNSWWTRIAIGLLLLVFILLQRFGHRRVSDRPSER